MSAGRHYLAIDAPAHGPTGDTRKAVRAGREDGGSGFSHAAGCPDGDIEGGDARPRPFIFAFRAPTKTFRLRMSFTKSKVDKSEIIEALENIIRELKAAK